MEDLRLVFVACKGCGEEIPLTIRTDPEHFAAATDPENEDYAAGPEARKCPVCGHVDSYEWDAMRLGDAGEGWTPPETDGGES